MAYISVVDMAQDVMAQAIRGGDKVIDATVGNGHDTVFLAKAVGDSGHVLGFDVQPEAIDNTRKRLQQQNLAHRVTLFLQDHAGMSECIPQGMKNCIKAVMFNLGYLPGGDKSRVTNVQSTLPALDAVLPQLMPGGVVTIVAYSGHTGGAVETNAVLYWSSHLDQTYTVEVFKPPGTAAIAPLLVIIKHK